MIRFYAQISGNTTGNWHKQKFHLAGHYRQLALIRKRRALRLYRGQLRVEGRDGQPGQHNKPMITAYFDVFHKLFIFLAGTWMPMTLQSLAVPTNIRRNADEGLQSI